MATRFGAVPQIRVVEGLNLPSVRRVARRPQHKFNLKTKPHAIVPFMIAPVLPGETLQNLLMQARVVTDPIKNSLIGWHKEYYFFYVKHRAFHNVDGNGWMADQTGALQAMMLDPTTSLAALLAGQNDAYSYTFKSGVEFVNLCLAAVVEEFFRDEEMSIGGDTIDGYPTAQIDQEGWHHSLKVEGAGTDDDELPGVDELEELDVLPGFTGPYAEWEKMRDVGLTDLSYEDFLRSYGVTIPKSEDEGPEAVAERHKPELIRFVREWTYPSNTVDPTDGSVASACSWSIAERADKKRFFKEPGFLFGVTVTRPKLYLGSQKGAAVGLLQSPYTWLPAVLEGHPYVSVTETVDSLTDGILQNQTADYWVDARDVFLYGDQFVNHAMDVAANHGVALPTASLDKHFPTEAMVDSLFVTAGTDYVREDGVVHLNILSRLRDSTP